MKLFPSAPLVGPSFLLLASLSFGCADKLERVPPETTPAFDTAPLEALGIDEAVLERAIDRLPDDHEIHSILVVRYGRLGFERYFSGYDENTLHDLRSATKSITSLVLGTTLSRGEIGGVDESMMKHLRSAYPDTTRDKDDIPIEALLTMQSGLDCDDQDPDSPGQEDKMYASRDWVGYFLELDVVEPPLRRASYCTGGVVTLGRIVEQATGSTFDDVAEERIFGPLGIEHHRFETFDEGRGVDTGGHLHLRPRDLAKIGQLVLDEGDWKGQSVVEASWIEVATTPHTTFDDGARPVPYGYLWWLDRVPFAADSLPVVFASGNGGQLLFVVPELELVAVFTGGAYNDANGQRLPFEVFARGIVGAVTTVD